MVEFDLSQYSYAGIRRSRLCAVQGLRPSCLIQINAIDANLAPCRVARRDVPWTPTRDQISS